MKIKWKRLAWFLGGLACLVLLYFVLYFSGDLYLRLERRSLQRKLDGYQALLDRDALLAGSRGDHESHLFEVAGRNDMSMYQEGLDTSEVYMEMHGFSQYLKMYVETALETTDATVPLPGERLVRGMGSKYEKFLELRKEVLDGDFPAWENRNGNGNINHMKIVHLGVWFAADALISFRECRFEESKASQAALARLIDGLLAIPRPQVWVDAASLGSVYSGVERKTMAGGKDLSIDKYYLSLKWTISRSAGSMLSACQELESYPFYKKQHRRERFIWRTVGRLWYRNSLLMSARRALGELKAMDGYFDCRNLRPHRPEVFERGFWIGTGREYNAEDMRMRLQRLYVNFELTNWGRRVLAGNREKGSSFLFDCEKVQAFEEERDGRITIGFRTPFDMKLRPGAIDVPPVFVIGTGTPR